MKKSKSKHISHRTSKEMDKIELVFAIDSDDEINQIFKNKIIQTAAEFCVYGLDVDDLYYRVKEIFTSRLLHGCKRKVKYPKAYVQKAIRNITIEELRKRFPEHDRIKSHFTGFSGSYLEHSIYLRFANGDSLNEILHNPCFSKFSRERIISIFIRIKRAEGAVTLIREEIVDPDIISALIDSKDDIKTNERWHIRETIDGYFERLSPVDKKIFRYAILETNCHGSPRINTIRSHMKFIKPKKIMIRIDEMKKELRMLLS